MTFTFRPALYRNSTLFELPRPITTLRVLDAWDFEQFKVPLADGDRLYGHSRAGIDLSIEGRTGTHAGVLCGTEETMLDTLSLLGEAFDITSDDDRYELFLYHDEASGTYRKYRSCATVRFEYDLSSPHLFTWSAVIHAEDPRLYTTAPGV